MKPDTVAKSTDAAMSSGDRKFLRSLNEDIKTEVYGPPSERSELPTGTVSITTREEAQQYIAGQLGNGTGKGNENESPSRRLANVLSALGPANSYALITSMPSSVATTLGLQGSFDALVKSGQFLPSDAAKVPAVQAHTARSSTPYVQGNLNDNTFANLINGLPAAGSAVRIAYAKACLASAGGINARLKGAKGASNLLVMARDALYRQAAFAAAGASGNDSAKSEIFSRYLSDAKDIAGPAGAATARDLRDYAAWVLLSLRDKAQIANALLDLGGVTKSVPTLVPAPQPGADRGAHGSTGASPVFDDLAPNRTISTTPRITPQQATLAYRDDERIFAYDRRVEAATIAAARQQAQRLLRQAASAAPKVGRREFDENAQQRAFLVATTERLESVEGFDPPQAEQFVAELEPSVVAAATNRATPNVLAQQYLAGQRQAVNAAASAVTASAQETAAIDTGDLAVARAEIGYVPLSTTLQVSSAQSQAELQSDSLLAQHDAIVEQDRVRAAEKGAGPARRQAVAAAAAAARRVDATDNANLGQARAQIGYVPLQRDVSSAAKAEASLRFDQIAAPHDAQVLQLGRAAAVRKAEQHFAAHLRTDRTAAQREIRAMPNASLKEDVKIGEQSAEQSQKADETQTIRAANTAETRGLATLQKAYAADTRSAENGWFENSPKGFGQSIVAPFAKQAAGGRVFSAGTELNNLVGVELGMTPANASASPGESLFSERQLKAIAPAASQIEKIGGRRPSVLIVPVVYGSGHIVNQTVLFQVKNEHGGGSRFVDYRGYSYSDLHDYQQNNDLPSGTMAVMSTTAGMNVRRTGSSHDVAMFVGKTHVAPGGLTGFLRSSGVSTVAGFVTMGAGIVTDVAGAVVEVGSGGLLTPVAAAMELGGTALFEGGLAYNAASSYLNLRNLADHGQSINPFSSSQARAYWANGVASAAGLGSAVLAPAARLAEVGDVTASSSGVRGALIRSAAAGHYATSRLAFGLGLEQFGEQGLYDARNWTHMSSSQRASALSGLFFSGAQMTAGQVARRAVETFYAGRAPLPEIPAVAPGEDGDVPAVTATEPAGDQAGSAVLRSRPSKLTGRLVSNAKIAAGTAAGLFSAGVLSKIGRVAVGPEESAGFSIARHLITVGKLQVKGRLASLINAAEDGDLTPAKADVLQKKILGVIGKYETPERVNEISTRLGNYFANLASKEPAARAREFEALKADLRQDLDYKLIKIDPTDYRTRRGAVLNFASAGSRALNVLGSAANFALGLTWKLPAEVLFGLANSGFFVRDALSTVSYWRDEDLAGRKSVTTAMRNVQRAYAAAGVPWALDAIARGSAGEALAAAGFTAGASLKAVLDGRLAGIKAQTDPEARASAIRSNAKRAQAAHKISSLSTIAYYLTYLTDMGGPNRPVMPGIPVARTPLRRALAQIGIPPVSPSAAPHRTLPVPRATHQVVVLPDVGVHVRSRPSFDARVIETVRSGSFLQATARRVATAHGTFDQVVVAGRTAGAASFGWVAAADVTLHAGGATGRTGRIDPALERRPQRFRAVIVRPGDTLASIAARYAADLNQVIALNEAHIIDPNLIFAGDTVYLPR